jgi:hypothetical protein
MRWWLTEGPVFLALLFYSFFSMMGSRSLKAGPEIDAKALARHYCKLLLEIAARQRRLADSTGAIMKFEKLGNFDPWKTVPASRRYCPSLAGAR